MSLKVEYVCDLNDGWGALNFVALQLAIADVGGIVVDLELRPFELYPDLPPEGLPMAEHMARNFGAADSLAMKTRDALSRLLQTWQVTPRANPGFCAAVWQRIRQLAAKRPPDAKRSR